MKKKLILLYQDSARFKLGMFDADEDVQWSKIPYSVVCSDEHYALSEKAARESMVLLKNDNNVLPLSKSIKSIAVIGPNANSEQVLLGNYHGTPHNKITPLKAIKAKLPNATVHYAKGSEIATGWPALEPIPVSVLKNGTTKGLKGEYFNNQNWEGEAKLIRADEIIDFTWMENNPLKIDDSNEFSVRWTGEITPKKTGKYRIGFKGMNLGKMYVNDSLHFEYASDHEPKTEYVDKELIAGKQYNIKIEMSNYSADPQAHLVWAKMDEMMIY